MTPAERTTQNLPTDDTVYAVEPSLGYMVHLYLHGYTPGKKQRHPVEVAMCNVGIHGARFGKHRTVKPIADAVSEGWFRTDGSDLCPVCAGRALSAVVALGRALPILAESEVTR